MSVHPMAFAYIQSRLYHLTLSSDLLDEVLVQILTLLLELQTLNLEKNSICYLGTKCFQNMKHLTVINLYDTLITIIREDAFQGLLNLDRLILWYTPLSSKSITFAIQEVNFLSLFRCKLQYASQPLFKSNASIFTLI